MIRNFLIVGIRNLRQHIFYSLLNVLGLAVGMACMLLAVMYVGHQFSFDRHHDKSDRVYRVIRKLQDVSGERYDLGTKPVAPHLRGKFPEVEAVTRMLVRRMWASHEDRGSDVRVCVTDAEVFDVFTLPMVVGDARTGLKDPHTAFLSETLARRLFGDEHPIGKTVNIHYKWFKGDFTINGILKDQPRTSNYMLQFDFLTTTYPEPSDKYPENGWREPVWEKWPSNWFIGPLRTYVLLHQEADVAELEKKLHAFAAAHQVDVKERYDFYLQPLERIHLYSMKDFGTAENNAGDIARCRMLVFVGLLVLSIACINYVNLVTARSAGRLREIGLHKVVGATRLQLIGQFLGESTLVALLAGVLAVLFASDALPYFNEFMDDDLHLTDAGSVFVLAATSCVLLGTGLLAGSYPAFALSAFEPVRALKGTLRSRRMGLNQVMVVLQFGISVVLIITTLVVHDQLSFVRSKELGFEKENIVVLPFFMRDRGLRPKAKTIVNELRAQPGCFEGVAVRLAPGDLRAQLTALKSVWKRFLPTRPFEYKFIDEVLDAHYRSETTLQKVCGVFAAVSILISCLGMLGLIAFAVHKRTKEIGIRKVLGASEGRIVLLLTRNFLWLTAIANLIGWPVAYLLMSTWLNDFAYRIELGPLMFVATGMLTIVIVLATVGGQAWRAACANPINALGNE